MTYQTPNTIDRVFNGLVRASTKAGLPLWGSRVLEVRGRVSGEPRRTPVNPLEVDGKRYLVAPRGNTQWVRNMRHAGRGELLAGRRREPFTAVEVADADKPPILRAYLRRWKWEVGRFFGGVGADATDEELLRIAPDHPVFRVRAAAAGDQPGAGSDAP